MFTFTSADQLTLYLSSPVTTNEGRFTAAYYDTITSLGIVNEGNSLGYTTGATPVVVFASPPINTLRHIRGFCFNNIDTQPVTVTLNFGGNTLTVSLNVGDFLQFNEKGDGFNVLDRSGNLKEVSSGGSGLSPWNSDPAPETFGCTAQAGVSDLYSRGDHLHALSPLPIASTTVQGITEYDTINPLPDGIANPGSSGKSIQSDHIHPLLETANGDLYLIDQTPGTLKTYYGAPVPAIAGVLPLVTSPYAFDWGQPYVTTVNGQTGY